MSDAVGTQRVSRVVGYKITKGDFRTVTPNLPQRVVILGEANTANQGSLDTNEFEVITAQQAGQRYGYGSPIYHIMRILKPLQGGGLSGVPIAVIPQAAALGSTARILEISPVGVATKNGTHTLKICGREGLDGTFYDINILQGDTSAEISDKIRDAINAVLGCPFSATSTEYEAIATTKWTGLTAQEANISVLTGDDDLGITYAVTQVQAASGTPSIAGALAQFGNKWNTIVINSYGTVTNIMSALEQFNGIPDPATPTGRYTGIIMKPFIALTGSIADDPSSITDARKLDVTIAICPAPLSEGFQFEAAANMCALFAPQAQETPHLDVSGRSYPDMPTPTDIGSMANYDFRDAFVKKGCSTVDLSASRYVVQDFVTTYHPDGEVPPQFRYCRSLIQDWNIRFGYYLLEQINVVDHAIASDDTTVSVSKVIKPKQWRAILFTYAENLANNGLIVDPSFMQESVSVNISTTNPDRLETFFRYKRSGYARIASTTAEAGFNFGTL